MFQCVLKYIDTYNKSKIADEEALIAVKCLSEIVHPFDGDLLPFPSLTNKSSLAMPLSNDVNECPQDITVRDTIGKMLLQFRDATEFIVKSALSKNIELAIYSLRVRKISTSSRSWTTQD